VVIDLARIQPPHYNEKAAKTTTKFKSISLTKNVLNDYFSQVLSEMFSRGTVRTGTPTQAGARPGGGKNKDRSSRSKGEKEGTSSVNQLFVFFGAVAIGMVLTVLFCSYFDQSGSLSGAILAQAGDNVGGNTNSNILEQQTTLVGGDLITLNTNVNAATAAIDRDKGGIISTLPRKASTTTTTTTTTTTPAAAPKVDTVKARAEATVLLGKVRESLRWLAKQMVDKGNPECPISWTRFSPAEVHIIYKVEEYLDWYLMGENQALFDQLLSGGLQCNAVQQEQQTVISKVIQMDICSEIEWYVPLLLLLFSIPASLVRHHIHMTSHRTSLTTILHLLSTNECTRHILYTSPPCMHSLTVLHPPAYPPTHTTRRYKLAQLAYPSASTILDVGGNKGYLGSLFLSLWGGGGYGVSPAALYVFCSIVLPFFLVVMSLSLSIYCCLPAPAAYIL
jgi:hypothetical protein